MQRDIVIVGCGIFGAAIAWALGRRGLGHRVLIVDRQPAASGATSRAAGLVTQARSDPSLQALAGETLAAIALLQSDCGEDVGCHRAGAVHLGSLTQQSALATLLPARIVVNAAGAWSNLLSVALGLPLPMAPVRSQYWITERSPEFVRAGPIVFMTDVRAYARPEMGALLFGARESTAAVANPRDLPENLQGFVFDATDPDGWANLAGAFEPLSRYLPAIERLGIAHYITGPSNYTPDGQPIVGTFTGLSGLLVATGCNGSGITYSAGVGRLIAELIGGDTPFVDASRLAPARAPHIDPFAPAFLQACAHARATKSTG